MLQGGWVIGQKSVEKSVDVTSVSKIVLDASNLFGVSLSTIKGSQVFLDTQMEGEYQEKYINSVKKEGTTLYIGVERAPAFHDINDKLSAHKVVSVHLDIAVPEFKEVVVYGDYTSISARGKYKLLELSTRNKPITIG